MLKRFLDFMAGREPEKMLFLTHTHEAFEPGQEKGDYLITRLKQTTPTGLIGGGRAACFEVYGRAIRSETCPPAQKTPALVSWYLKKYGKARLDRLIADDSRARAVGEKS